MKKPDLWIAMLTILVIFGLSACGGSEESAPPTDTPMPTSALAGPAATASTVSGEPTVDAGAEQPTVYVDNAMNLRTGPGTDFAVAASAVPGDSFRVVGVNVDGDWWQIEVGSELAWVYAPFVRAENVGAIAPVTTPTILTAVTPAPQVTPIASSAVTQEIEYAPAPAPVGTVVVYEESITLPTYPMESYQSAARNDTFNWPYQRFDYERFRESPSTPEDRAYRLIVLENAFLKITILPEMGGRIWQVIHKASGDNVFYQNSVVKPTAWGPSEQRGWAAIGGLEWNLPVVEHGYDWGVEWGYLPLQHSEDLASVTLFTPRDGRVLNGSVTVSLRSGAASFEIEPTLSNLSEHEIDFSFWMTAMLAPGPGNHPSAETEFILPGDEMTVHSSEDARLPASGAAFSWPVYNGVDYSILGNWTTYSGFFERPAAHGPFVAVYDHAAEAGVVRVFPAQVARGSKAFGLGWQMALDSGLYTDDRSAYVELHGGLTPTFDDTIFAAARRRSLLARGLVSCPCHRRRGLGR